MNIKNLDHWRNAAFLTGTGLVVAAEIVHAFDDDPGTRPWTDYLSRLPMPLLAPAAASFSTWLVLHLISARRKREAAAGK